MFIVIALIVLILALLVTVAVLTGGDGSVDLDMFGAETTASASTLYLTGMVTGLVVLAALFLLRIGMKRGWRRRRRLRDLQRRADEAEEQRRAQSSYDDEDDIDRHNHDSDRH